MPPRGDAIGTTWRGDLFVTFGAACADQSGMQAVFLTYCDPLWPLGDVLRPICDLQAGLLGPMCGLPAPYSDPLVTNSAPGSDFLVTFGVPCVAHFVWAPLHMRGARL